jgi:DNA-binding MarR family transcriptional regulator
MVELAEITVMDRSTLGRNLRPLQREGLIQLTVGKEDRRSRRIALTSKGRVLLKQGRQLWAKAQAAFEATYGAEHAARLRKELLQLAATDFTLKG